jgi:metal-responsive CopG/Arc/MetJ family transcriptional regulator
MKTKTSVTLSADVVAAVDELAGPGGSRSAVIERILRQFVRRRQRAASEARDLAILNRHSERLNAEAADVFKYQTWPGE